MAKFVPVVLPDDPGFVFGILTTPDDIRAGKAIGWVPQLDLRVSADGRAITFHFESELEVAFARLSSAPGFRPESKIARHARRITRCRSCRARIVWLETHAQKTMPVDADTVDPADVLFDRNAHRSHFATCPNAKRHRKPRPPAKKGTSDDLFDK